MIKSCFYSDNSWAQQNSAMAPSCYRPYNQRLFFPLYQLLHCLFTELWHQETLKPPVPKDNHRQDNFTARSRLQVWGKNNRHLGKEQGNVWGQANQFWHSCLPLPPCPTLLHMHTRSRAPSPICTLNSLAAECSSQLFHVILEQTAKTSVL